MLPIIYKTFNLLLCLIELRLSVTLSAYLFSITLYLSFFLFVCPCISLYLNISSNLPSVPLFLSFCFFLFSVYLILPPPLPPSPVKKLYMFSTRAQTLSFLHFSEPARPQEFHNIFQHYTLNLGKDIHHQLHLGKDSKNNKACVYRHILLQREFP